MRLKRTVELLQILLFGTLAFLVSPVPLRAQAPDEAWRTIRSQHFAIHFPLGLEMLARRAGGEAERAFFRLSQQLSPPRTPIDLVLTDERDASNGQARYFPFNAVIIWAHPPVDNAALRFGDDWLQQVVTHEVAHVFHLDRTRGVWRLAQAVLGRHSATFPNARSPRWLTEGIAVAYESKIGSGGRLNGTELYATLDAVAGKRPLTPGRLSIESPYWPGGEIAYFGGSWLVSEAMRSGGDSSMRRFIDRAAAFPIPYLWDLHAKRSFGASFERLAREATAAGGNEAAVSATVRSKPFWEARSPRWRGDSIYFTAAGPRDVTGLFVAHDDEVDRVDRRNSTNAFAFYGDHMVYSQLDFTDPYRLFSALYRDDGRIDGTERLDSPDVRADATIIAVDASSGTSRLALVSSEGVRRPFAGATQDVNWSAPRWSRRGDLIAAARWIRGGEAEIAVLDTTGRVVASYARERAVQSNPSWDVDDRAIYFTSDRSGRTAVYRISLRGADSGRVSEVARDAYGLYDAEISGDGSRIAALRPTADGLVLVTLDVGEGAPAGASTLNPGTRDTIVVVEGPVRGYSPLRNLIPRYWTPRLETSSRGNTLVGAHSSASDVVGRYSWIAEASWDVETGEFYGNGILTYRGFGRPVVDLGFGLTRAFARVPADSSTVGGDIARRSRTASLTLSWVRPRVRSAWAFVAGADMELRDFRVSPDEFVSEFDSSVLEARRFPSVVASVSWSNLQRATLAIGPEEGVALSLTGRRRWRTDDPDATTAHSVIGVARGFRSFGLWGHARHSIGMRAAYGWAEANGTTQFGVGGVSGTSLEIVPGYSVGDSPRTFFVRGFRPGAVFGTRAWSATAEYRAPLARIGRGLWPLPLFFQRTAIAVFGDAGGAWCPAVEESTLTCPAGGTPRRAIASAGAELLLDAALNYDETNRFRLGFAAPVHGRGAEKREGTLYFSLGIPF
jgi:hypothetical protein